MARQDKVFSIESYKRLKNEIESGGNSITKITNLSDYSGVEIVVEWYEKK